ncbi:MAG: transcription termination/antitermination NusG family protein [Thermodesulfobacteriota bacterium]|nr:transcription termination/antitermination NusG family protein [Thermodesulfobacteriota bacterium]
MNLWYVIQTKPRKEKEAASYLWTRGLEVFNPLTEVLSPRNARMEKIQKSLFPNYVFVKFDLDQSYNLVRWARGG